MIGAGAGQPAFGAATKIQDRLRKERPPRRSLRGQAPAFASNEGRPPLAAASSPVPKSIAKTAKFHSPPVAGTSAMNAEHSWCLQELVPGATSAVCSTSPQMFVRQSDPRQYSAAYFARKHRIAHKTAVRIVLSAEGRRHANRQGRKAARRHL